eukprot:TRINITY_DN662_c0_g2_i1.p1 TRINITY_DN662_c0_g2~~TRINITY_DN662_c0_g2_i1.p1  ORF type:complete len:815 (+),score=358.79 TRINITY_DN662_c0_g2_i1:355-2799(+)
MGGDMRERIAARYNHLGAFKYRDRLDHLVECKPWKEEAFKPPPTYDPNFGLRSAAVSPAVREAARGRITGMGSSGAAKAAAPVKKKKKPKEEKPLGKGDNVMYTPPGGGPAVKGVIETVTFHEGTTSYMVALSDGRKRGARADHLRRCGATLASALDILAEDSDDEEWAALVASGAIAAGHNIQHSIRSAATGAQRAAAGLADGWAEEEVDLTALRELGERSGGKARKGGNGFAKGERVVYHPMSGPPAGATIFAVDDRTDPPSFVLTLDDGGKRGAALRQIRKWGASSGAAAPASRPREDRRASMDAEEELQEDEVGLLDRFPVGTVVVAQGLRSAAEMNGLRGKVVDVSPDDDDRLMVDFGPEHGECALRPDNLQLVPKKFLQRLALVERGEAGARTKERQAFRLEREAMNRDEKTAREFLPERLAFLQQELESRAAVERRELGGRLFFARMKSEESGQLWWHSYLRFLVPWLSWGGNLLGLLSDGKVDVPQKLRSALGTRMGTGQTVLPPEALESPEALERWVEGDGGEEEEEEAPAAAAAGDAPTEGAAAAEGSGSGASADVPAADAPAADAAAPAAAADAPAGPSADEVRLAELRQKMQEWKQQFREQHGADPTKDQVQGDEGIGPVYAEWKELQGRVRQQRAESQGRQAPTVAVVEVQPTAEATPAGAGTEPAATDAAGEEPAAADAPPAADPPTGADGPPVTPAVAAEAPAPAAEAPAPAAEPAAAAVVAVAAETESAGAAPPAAEVSVVAVEAAAAAPAAEQPAAADAAAAEWRKEEELIKSLLQDDAATPDSKPATAPEGAEELR